MSPASAGGFLSTEAQEKSLNNSLLEVFLRRKVSGHLFYFFLMPSADFTQCACLFPTDEVESEKWYLSPDFPPTTIKTEPITDEPPSGLVPSVTLTITAISTPFDKEEPPLEMNAGVKSLFFHKNRLDQEITDRHPPKRHLIFLEPVVGYVTIYIYVKVHLCLYPEHVVLGSALVISLPLKALSKKTGSKSHFGFSVNAITKLKKFRDIHVRNKFSLELTFKPVEREWLQRWCYS